MGTLDGPRFLTATLQCLLSLDSFPESLVGADGLLIAAVLALCEALASPRKVMLDRFVPALGDILTTSGDDAHAFAGLFIAQLHKEEPAIVNRVFIGELSAKTICERCRKPVIENERFTTLPLPLALVDSRRILFAPWDLTRPAEPKSTPGAVTVPSLLLGLTADGFEPVEQTGVYTDVWAFEIPALFDQEPEQGLAILFFTCGGARLCDRVVMRAPIDTVVNVTLLAHNRIEGMIEPAAFHDVQKKMKIVQGPARFTNFPRSRGCNEKVVVEIPQGRRV
jgi:hypothetical protein